MIGPQNIKWIKNVTHIGHENGEYAYLDLTDTEFVLHFPDRFQGRVLDASTADLIIVYQWLGRHRFLTHLVQPLDDEVKEFVVAPNFQFGRLVKTIAYSGVQGAVPIEHVPSIDLRNSFGLTIPIADRLRAEELGPFQNAVWDHFAPFMSHGLTDNSDARHILDNDELERDFESPEGKELFRQHRVRERDSRLTAEKKRQAQGNGNFYCSVCGFSFETVYGESYIECHHTVPISKGERVTKLDDLALVCSNCHRMLHRRIDGDYLSIEELKRLINSRLSC